MNIFLKNIIPRYIYTISSLLLFMFPIRPICAQWVKVLDKDNIQVFTKPSSVGGLSHYKAQATIDTSIEELYVFFTDFQNYTKWVNNCTFIDLIDEIPDSVYIYYSYFDMPWPAMNRDVLSKLSIQHVSPQHIIVQSEPIKYDYPRKANAIHIVEFKEQYTLKEMETEKVYLEMQGSYNPEGYVPDWLLRKMLKYGPYDVILKIRSELK